MKKSESLIQLDPDKFICHESITDYCAIDIWITRDAVYQQQQTISRQEVAALRRDTKERLLPLIKRLIQERRVYTGPILDEFDRGLWESMNSHRTMDEALGRLNNLGVSTEIIDAIRCSEKILTVGFLQLAETTEGFFEARISQPVQWLYGFGSNLFSRSQSQI